METEPTPDIRRTGSSKMFSILSFSRRTSCPCVVISDDGHLSKVKLHDLWRRGFTWKIILIRSMFGGHHLLLHQCLLCW